MLQFQILAPRPLPFEILLKDIEQDYLIRVIEQTQWKVGGKNGAAEILGLNRSILRARIRKLCIHQP